MKYRHRDTIFILKEIAELPTDEERVAVLKLAPRSVRSLLYFALSPAIELDLPKGNLNVVPITGQHLSTSFQSDAEEDLLGSEAARGVLVRVFAKGVNAAPTSKRRLDIYLDLAQRVNDEERRVLDCIRDRHCLPYPYDSVTPQVVAAAYGADFLDTPPTPVAAPEPYSQLPPSSEGGITIEQASQAPPRKPQQLTEAEAKYQAALRRMRWG